MNSLSQLNQLHVTEHMDYRNVDDSPHLVSESCQGFRLPAGDADGHSPKGLPCLVTDLSILLQVTRLSLTTADSRRRTRRQEKGFPLGLLHLDRLRVQSRFMMGNPFPAEA